MRNFGRASAHEFIGDRIVYRNLIPMDVRIPPMKEVIKELGMMPIDFPRKSSLDYAKIVSYQINYAHFLASPKNKLKKLVYVGDTFLGDGTAYSNICSVNTFDGICIIISENTDPPKGVFNKINGRLVFSGNRWKYLVNNEQILNDRNYIIDDQTVLILDLDKTILGARGRNNKMIDKARLDAAHLIARDILGPDYDQVSFQNAYDAFDKDEYHKFTTDNVDYLVYLSLFISGGFYGLDFLKGRILSTALGNFKQFICEVDRESGRLPKPLLDCHKSFYECFCMGDPTPFKTFRKYEYKYTVDAMGKLPDRSSPDQLIKQEIALTQEVRQFANFCHDHGALVFSLSDKPDEASVPAPEYTSSGYKPIHQTETHAIGEE